MQSIGSIGLGRDGMLRAPRAAAYLGLSTSTLAKMRLRGDGPIYAKLGRAILYDVRDLDAWVTVRKRTSTSHLGDDAA